MKSLGLKLSVRVLVLALWLGLAACGFIKGSGGKLSPPPFLPDMSGSWDFTATGSNSNMIGLEAVLPQATHGTLTATTSLSGGGGTGGLFEMDISGSSLSTATDISIDYLRNTCSNDDGSRILTGTINASSHVTLTYSAGGSSTVTINGTFNPSTTPPFFGSFTVSAPGCKSNGQTGTITGVLASSHKGAYSGTSASDSTDTITMTMTETNTNPPGFCCASIAGNGTDSKNDSANFAVASLR